MSGAGSRLFARYAFAPNELGYCGPAQTRELFEVGAGVGAGGVDEPDVTAVARRFSGAWPYQRILAEVAGIPDPLDERVVRAYWTGGDLLDAVDPAEFGRRLLETIGAQAGHYWKHLTPDLLAEAMPTHGFHVFGVYPWSRLLVGSSPGTPLTVLDSCRIRWGEALGSDGDHVVVSCRRLVWDAEARRLALGDAAEERVRHRIDGEGFVADPVPGELLALHWDWTCDRLTPEQAAELERRTEWQLAATNTRLAAS